MKNSGKTSKFLDIILIAVMTIVVVCLSFISCQEDNPISSINSSEPKIEEGNLGKKVLTYTYPIWGRENFYNRNGVWLGGTMTLSNGSEFVIAKGSMIPPNPYASSYYLTMRADMDSVKNEIIISFTPSGVLFDPPAELILDYNDLGIEIANLYYIDENGNYIPQTPNHINFQKKTITIYIDHFSRYAIGEEQ
jgi:hypothetical protein